MKSCRTSPKSMRDVDATWISEVKARMLHSGKPLRSDNERQFGNNGGVAQFG